MTTTDFSTLAAQGWASDHTPPTLPQRALAAALEATGASDAAQDARADYLTAVAVAAGAVDMTNEADRLAVLTAAFSLALRAPAPGQPL